MTGSLGSLILLLCCLPVAVMSLTCYSCVFPAISPLDCLKFPQECPAGQRCLSSVATGVKGSISIVLHEKSCAVPSQCGLSGEKHAAGLNFTYKNVCCDTDLCNSAVHLGAPCWGDRLLLSLLGVALLLLLA
ncbi:lymphocyte antigen 6 complex locus protein G6c-like [Colossoma macropomum]|uniref:lymphocyte antigen 6 complex locus protein G6c-like n=1 Tax=Colossoma macropomum TaxID=42526 RepID=UPI0018653A41|nr:lymphocyte antigen 6 complex locus protein G6c-like [Colossoma macropomum]